MTRRRACAWLAGLVLLAAVALSGEVRPIRPAMSGEVEQVVCE